MKAGYTFAVARAGDWIEDLNDFYKSCGRQTQLSPEDTVLVARLNTETVGAVRLCFEEGTYVLRTMQIKNDLQGKGVGRLMLNHFENLIKDRSIQRIYCMPFAHLEYFYGLIGFKKIESSQAPSLLQRRIQDFHKNHPGEQAILMAR